VPARQEAGGMSLDAAIMAQLQNAKASMGPGNPMMAGAMGAARPGQPTPGLPVMPPGFPMGMPPQAVAPQQSPAPPPGANLLSVAVNGLPFRYQLNEADLREMCQRWGPLQNVVIYRDGQREVGVIVFGDAVDTADCARQLSGYACTFDSPGGPASGSLAVVIGGPEQLAGPRQGQPGAVPMGAPGPMGGAPQMAPMGGQAPQPQMMGQPGMEMQGAKGAPEMMKGKGNGKGHPGWSAKVVIQAERLHPDFPTITKVCGPGGQNMEHIRSQGNCSVELRGKTLVLLIPGLVRSFKRICTSFWVATPTRTDWQPSRWSRIFWEVFTTSTSSGACSTSCRGRRASSRKLLRIHISWRGSELAHFVSLLMFSLPTLV